MNKDHFSQGASLSTPLLKRRGGSFFVVISGFILLMLFSATLVTANSIPLTDQDHPLVHLPVTLNLTFNKEVSIVNATLLSNNEITKIFSSDQFIDQGDHKNFLLTIPPSGLSPANYSLQIEKTLYNSTAQSTFDEVTFTYLPENRIYLKTGYDLNVVSQTIGYSSKKPYDVHVGTILSANCKYTFSSGAPTSEFSSQSTLIDHIIEDVNASSADIKVNCTFSDQTTDEKTLHVGFIPNAPKFSVTITPPKLVDPEKMWLNISVSDKHTIPLKLFCTAKIDGQNYSFADHMGHSNIEGDMESNSSYQSNPWLHIQYTKESTESFVVPVNIKCWNLAGTSTTVNKSFEVALIYPLKIKMESPGEFTKNKEPTLAVTVWRGPQQVSAESCVVSGADIDQKRLTPADQNKKLLFSTTLPTLEDGINKYSVDCELSSAEAVSKNLTITLDTTAPTGYALSVPVYVCLDNSSSASLRANIGLENGSIPDKNLRGYLYNLSVNAENGNTHIASGESPSSPILYSLKEEDPKLIGKGYKWETNVVDLAGNSAPTEPGSAITTLLESGDIACDLNPPVITLKPFTINNLLSINVSCEDAEGNCADYFNYSFVQGNLSLADCKAQAENMTTSEYSSPIRIYQQGTLCVVGWDNASNTDWVNYKPEINSSGSCTSNYDCPPSNKCNPVTGECLDMTHCSNGQLDEADGETDVDCGGPCDACGEGMNCSSNDDCKSSFCDNNSCEVVSCTDGVKNGYETDVDCGGPTCPTCPDDLDTDQDGMPDGWEKAHGLDPNDPSDATQDPDGDGYSNYQEYRNGTDPHVFDGKKPDVNKPGDISKGFSVWGLILLILGLLTMGGSGYWLYYLHEDESKNGLPPNFQRTVGRSSQQSRFSNSNNRTLQQQPGRLSGLTPQQQAVQRAKLQRNQILLKREQEREAKRRRLLGELGVKEGTVKSKEGFLERTRSKSLSGSAGRLGRSLGEDSSFVSLDKIGQSKKPVQNQSTTPSQFDAFSELDEVIEDDEKVKRKNKKNVKNVKNAKGKVVNLVEGSKAKESEEQKKLQESQQSKQSQDTKGSGDQAGKSSSTSTRTTQPGERRG